MRARLLLRSPLSPAEAERALGAAISPPPLLGIPLLAKRGSKGMIGEVGGGRVRVFLLPVSRNSASPVFRGRILPDGEGSRLEGEFGVHDSVLVTLALLACFVVGLAVMGLSLIVLGDAEPEGGAGTGFVMLGVAIGFGLWGRFVWYLCRRFAAGEEDVLLRFLGNTLRTGAASPPPSPPRS